MRMQGKLLGAELARRGLGYITSPICRAYFRDQIVDESPIDCTIVEEEVILVGSALYEDNEFNVHRGISFLEALDLEWGIAANFGKKELQITGLHRKVL